jgi:hypothetical protein
MQINISHGISHFVDIGDIYKFRTLMRVVYHRSAADDRLEISGRRLPRTRLNRGEMDVYPLSDECYEVLKTASEQKPGSLISMHPLVLSCNGSNVSGTHQPLSVVNHSF